MVTDLLAIFPICAVWRWSHTPFGRTVRIHDGEIWLYCGRRKGCVPEHLLSNVALCRDWTSFAEGHTSSSRWRILIEPLNCFCYRINSRRCICCATSSHARTSRLRVLVYTDTPFINRQTIWLTNVSHTSHGHPRVSIAPTQGRVFLTIVHVAKDFALYAQPRKIAACEKLGNVFVCGPVHRNTEIIAKLCLEVSFVLFVVKPIVPEPIQVRELLRRKLIELSIGASCE